eukprot:SAG11_NODE_10856_length_801_cov_0.861823_1_plen_68_part_10
MEGDRHRLIAGAPQLDVKVERGVRGDWAAWRPAPTVCYRNRQPSRPTSPRRPLDSTFHFLPYLRRTPI